MSWIIQPLDDSIDAGFHRDLYLMYISLYVTQKRLEGRPGHPTPLPIEPPDNETMFEQLSNRRFFHPKPVRRPSIIQSS
jgi:hypothetical protein